MERALDLWRQWWRRRRVMDRSGDEGLMSGMVTAESRGKLGTMVNVVAVMDDGFDVVASIWCAQG